MDSCKVPMGIVPALRDIGVSIADVLATARLPAGSGAWARTSSTSWRAAWRALPSWRKTAWYAGASSICAPRSRAASLLATRSDDQMR